jgi:hypothetical protein
VGFKFHSWASSRTEATTPEQNRNNPKSHLVRPDPCLLAINVLYTSTLTVNHSLYLHTFKLKKRLSGIKLAEGIFHHEFQSFCIVITPMNTFPRYKLARDSVFLKYELHMRIHCDQPSPSFFQNNNATMLRKSAALKNCNDAQSSKLK